MIRSVCPAVLAVILIPTLTLRAAEPPGHEHGVSEMTVALEGNIMAIELKGPAANFAGFEHVPKNVEEARIARAALSALSEIELVAGVPPAADCRLTQMEISAPALRGLTAEAAAKKAELDAKKPGWKRVPADSEEAAADAPEGSAVATESKPEPEVHSEFSARYRLACMQPDALQALQLRIFTLFDTTLEVRATVIKPDAEKTARLTASSPRLTLQ